MPTPTTATSAVRNDPDAFTRHPLSGVPHHPAGRWNLYP